MVQPINYMLDVQNLVQTASAASSLTIRASGREVT
jgi:hypothetical protein